MTVIIQDYYAQESGRERRRIYLSKWMEKVCLKAGFRSLTWNKRFARGTGFKQLWASRGLEVVMDEDVVTYMRPDLTPEGGVK